MKLTKDTSSTSTIEGTAIKLVDLEGEGDYYALMSALVSYLDLSYGVVQRAATRLGCYSNVKGVYCVPLRMLHALCLELRRRYPKKLKVQELWAATLPEPVTTSLEIKQALPTETPEPSRSSADTTGTTEPTEERLKREERKVTAQEEEEPSLAEGREEEETFYNTLPKELKEWTFDVLKASDAGGLALLYRWVTESESATLQELWGNYVYELHKLDEFYPKLRYRLSVIYEHRKNPLGKLKLLKV